MTVDQERKEETGKNRRLDLFAATVNLYHMNEQYSWAKGRLDDSILRFGESIPALEEQGKLFGHELRKIHQENLDAENGTQHKLTDYWNQEQITEFDNLLGTVGYGNRGTNGFFYTPDCREEGIEKAVRQGTIYRKKDDLYVTKGYRLASPKMIGVRKLLDIFNGYGPDEYSFMVKNPFTRLADDLERRTVWIKQELDKYQSK